MVINNIIKVTNIGREKMFTLGCNLEYKNKFYCSKLRPKNWYNQHFLEALNKVNVR